MAHPAHDGFCEKKALNGINSINQVGFPNINVEISGKHINMYLENDRMSTLRFATKLATYDNHEIVPLGACTVTVTCQNQVRKLDTVVVDIQSRSLFRRTWITAFDNTPCASISSGMVKYVDLIDILDIHDDLFENTPGCVQNFIVKLNLKNNAVTRYSSSRCVPFGLREHVEEEIKRKVIEWIMEPVYNDEVYLLQSPELGSVGITFKQLYNSSLRDSEILQIKRYIRNGWPNQIDQEIRPYSNRRSELSVEDDTLLWLQRIVLPKELRTSKYLIFNDGEITSEVMYGRMLMTFFDRLRQSCQGRTSTRRNLQKVKWDSKAKPRDKQHQPVWLHDSISGKWNPTNVEARSGWSSYRVWTNSGLRRRHASNLRPRTQSAQEHSSTNQNIIDFTVTKESSEKTTSLYSISHENDENGIEAKNKQDACVSTDRIAFHEPIGDVPCEQGTHVALNAVVWKESDSGVLVVNAKWRGKSFIGSLLDVSKQDWRVTW
ncbi:hypothetical protein GJ496_001557 [Pomphorhynchus laevis]|nr:hypothetical protein GJ496_001557 [Pomphorhynchus laevis]